MRSIIGISSFYHDSSCCLLLDGKLIAAAQEERFTRIKHDSRLPIRSFSFCLKQGNISVNDIDCIAYYEDPHKKKERQQWMLDQLKLKKDRLVEYNSLLKSIEFDPISDIRKRLGYEGKIISIPHHISHAASAYYYSGFEESAIFVADGVGEWATTSYGVASGNELRVFEQVDFPNSIGLLYSAITAYLGFEVNEGEYKVMGLASYGNPVYIREFNQLLEITNSGQYKLNFDYFDFLSQDRMYTDKLPLLFQQPPRTPHSLITKFHMNVAASLQFFLEETLIEITKYLRSCTQSENLCMAGGVTLNCSANARLRNEQIFRNIFVQPAANDAGGSLGAAMVVWKRHNPNSSSEPLSSLNLGKYYCDNQILEMLSKARIKHTSFHKDKRKLYEEVANILSNGKIVGWFQGAMEFGPRALGSRSILADPRQDDMQDRVNLTIKKRESFRPFAPAILEEYAQDFFSIDKPSPFMIDLFDVLPGSGLPAVTHTDNTARVQTVDTYSNQDFYHLLRAFKELTGCPVLLNTSFNLKDEPIVESPLDALICFSRSGLDYLVLGSSIINKEDIPTRWSKWLDEKVSPRAPKTSPTSRTYTYF